MITWDSLYNEINSLGCPSEISMLEITSIIDKYKNIANNEYSDDYDDDNYNYDDDNYNYDNYDQDSSDWINPDNLESPEVDDDKENEEIVDETLLPEKFRGKKWIIKKILGEGKLFPKFYT
ncbi:unnamed protein product [Onchocerca ochengi]|uniref:ORFan n=1 Tax=Onchocerca ochengi TaxID=42157 RepID=A0A182EXV6_ONCOC|nr:unnamed protein product [Onchocerca ochengi]